MDTYVPFFGSITRKFDIDFLFNGIRKAILQGNIDISNGQGGIISGLEVFASADNRSIFINAGTFYNGGSVLSTINGIGAGERGQIFTKQTFTTLTPTGIVAGNQTVLLVYAKTASQNINPSPLAPQVVYAAKNIQTGETQPVRQYNAGVIVISNPISRGEVVNFAGIPLALLQIDPNGFIVSIDNSVRRNFVIGGAIDLVQEQVLPQAIPDDFLVTRMFADGQIVGSNFMDGAVTSPKIAIWDGSSSNFAISGTVIGSGVGTDHIKDNAITTGKLSYSGSTADFSTRNRVFNSSFEFSPSQLTSWTILSGTNFVSPSNVTINNNSAYVKYGNQSASLLGGFNLTAQSVGITQTIDFVDNLNGKPISAFAWVKPLSGFNLAVSGTTGIQASLDFLSTGGSLVQTVSLGGYSGTSTDWQKIAPTSEIIAPTARFVRFNIFGAFNNTVYVDGVFVGNTSLIPGYDAAPNEQIVNLDTSAITTGQFAGTFIADGAIQTSHIRRADGGVNTGATPVGIVDSNFALGAINGNKIQDHTITAQQVSASVIAIPQGAIIMWNGVGPGGSSCPVGWNDITSLFAGRFPLGVNTGANSAITTPGIQSTTPATGNVDQSGKIGVSAVSVGNHNHGQFTINVNNTGGANTFGGNTQAGGHTHEEIIPYYTVLFCQKA